MDTNMMSMTDAISPTQYQMPSQTLRTGCRLIILENGEMAEYDLRSLGVDRIFIGRDPSKCNIVLSSPSISKCHLKVKIANGRVYVGDVGSTNGTMLYKDGQRSRMEPKRYYVKESGDMIFRVERQDQRDPGVVFLLTDSEDKSAWRKMPITDQPITIGRDPKNRIVMESPSFSRFHAVIFRQGDQLGITDNNSMNGVYVDSERIQGTAMLRESSMILIAGTIMFVLGGNLYYQGSVGGISLRLENISKVVRNGKKILNNVYCDIGSNEFVAIIGGSGAGKTTVMNAMSGFDDDIVGNVYCNGINLKKNFAALKNMIGFVPQQDIIYENLKLYRMLYHTAKMKMPSDTSKAEIEKRIKKVLKMVDLEAKTDTYIRELSGGQKKRASIAVELLADPGLFFLDEPTSGLDPDTEQSLMHTLAELSKTDGKTIIMVTHTTQSIDLCDKVIFMGPGGKICYCGPPEGITSYFQKKSLVDVYNELANRVDQWNGWYLKKYFEEHQNVQRNQAPTAAATGLLKKTKQVSAMKQLGVLTVRYFELIWNDKQRLTLLLLQPIIIAFLLTVVANDDAFKIYNSTKSIMFALACSGIWIGLFNTIQEICKERAILKREYMANLKLWAYILSKYIVQGVICIVQTTILTTIFLLMMEHAPKKEQILPTPQLEIWLTVLLTILASASMGLIVSALVKNSDRAMAVAPFLLIIQLLFSGVLFELEGVASKISCITVSRWAMECLGNITNLNKLDMSIKTMPHEAEDFYERGVGHLWQTWGILLLITVICGIVSTIVLRNLKKDHR